jgi:hypothetical protein
MIARADPPTGAVDARLRATIIAVALSGAALTLGALILVGLRAALSTALGAALAALNLWALARIVFALLPGEQSPPRNGAGRWALLAVLKMFALFAVVWLFMRCAFLSPLALLAGFGALPVGIAIGSLVSDRGTPP